MSQDAGCIPPDPEDYRKKNGQIKTAALNKARKRYESCVKKTTKYQTGYQPTGFADAVGAFGDVAGNLIGGAKPQAFAPEPAATAGMPTWAPLAMGAVLLLVVMNK